MWFVPEKTEKFSYILTMKLYVIKQNQPMKYITILLTFISLSTLAQTIETKKINSSILSQERELLIYWPWQYDEFPEKKFEVIYVFDAQAREMFDQVHSTLQFLGGQEFAFIVVGVKSPYVEETNQSRNKDFLPQPLNDETIEKRRGQFGGAGDFSLFLKNEVVPYIDKNYRTLPTRVAVGHSNGGTFISYCLLTEPDLFDAFIAISPNYAYDKGQMVDRFREFNPNDLHLKKFVFISNANENSKTEERWNGWAESREKIVDILKNEKFGSKIHLETKDFSDTENHSSTYPIGVFYGLKAYIDYQFRTGENITAYYDQLANNNLISLNPENTNMFAYECFWANKPSQAIIVINWAIHKFPDEHNLYDSQGEFYETIGDLKKAKQAYLNAIDVLKKEKNELDEKAFEEKMNYYKGNYKRVGK